MISNVIPRLALAYANRAVALMNMGFYREAMQDCQIAIDHNYPDNKRDKIYLRVINCASELNKPDLVMKTLNDLKTWSDRYGHEKFLTDCKLIQFRFHMN